MNYLDLFHGIGGFAYGAWLAGMKFENHYCSDIEPYCQKLYRLRFPESNQLGDCTRINYEKLPKGDWVITGGFPCQPFSVAGKKFEDKDKRNMWPESIRAVRKLRPSWVIFENVYGALNYIDGQVVPDLRSENYTTERIVIPAQAIGAPHRRKRIWVIAYSNSNRLQRKHSIASKTKGIIEEWIYIKRVACQVQSGEINCIPQSWIIRKDDGIPREVDRLKGLGNSIVPQIAKLLFETIKGYVYEV